MLFADKIRTRMSPMRQGERIFEFYDSSGRESFGIYRDLLNSWISNYPFAERSELIKRFTKGSDSQYYATLAELMVREALLSAGGRLESHPKLPHSSARPDFRKLSKSDKVEAYIEVTTCAQSEKAVAGGSRYARIYNLVDSIDLPAGYFFSFSVEEQGEADPRLRLLKNQIEHWLKDIADRDAYSDLDVRIFEIADWKFELRLMRFSDPTAKAARSIGASFSGARWTNGCSEIRSRLEGKAKRYGVLDAPFLLVIVDCKGEIGWGDSGRRTLVDALFGDESITIIQDALGEITGIPQRKFNGFFGHPGNPKYQNVSAVLLIPQPDLWALRNPLHAPIFIHNPWSHYCFSHCTLPVSNFYLGTNGHLEEKSGLSFADMLALPSDWPPSF